MSSRNTGLQKLYVLPHRLILTSRSHLEAVDFIRLALEDLAVPLEKL